MKLFAAFTVFFVASFAADFAQAFTLNSASDSSVKGWSNHTVTFRLNPANCPSNVDGLISAAISSWNSVPTSDLIVQRGVDTVTTFAQLNAGTATDVPVLICDPNFSAHSGIGGNGVAGVALVSPPATGGNIRYAFLLINVEPGSTGNVSSASEAVVSIVIAHEIGHVLGLGHSADVNALMYYNASAKAQLTLAQDDIDGISYLYPRNEGLDNKMMGCGTIVDGGNIPPTQPALFLFAIPLLTFFALRKRQKTVSV
jgi:hypothetical protein